ncbi:DUF6417 family protein [Streptomyces sp. NPDC002550]
MGAGRAWLETLRALRELENSAEWGWVLADELLPRQQRLVDAAAGQGLAELADRETRAELSAYEDRPVRWAARLSPHGHDALTYADADPTPERQQLPAGGERLVELYRAELEALSLYIHLGERLRVPPAEGLAQKVRTARQLGRHWRLFLNAAQIESVAYAFYLRSLSGSATEANRFAREYGVACRMEGDRHMASPRLQCEATTAAPTDAAGWDADAGVPGHSGERESSTATSP